MPREIVTSWTSNGHSGIKTVMFFDTGHTVGVQRQAVHNLWTSVKAGLDDQTTFSVDTAGREFNDSTGALTGAWTETLAHTGIGAQVGNPVPDLAQVLFRWITGAIVGGRFLTGRTFVPGLALINLVDGNVSSGALTTFQAAGETLTDGGVGFGVWHRPVLPEGTPPSNPANLPRSGGVFQQATACQVWAEMAAQRRRRL